MLKMEKRPILLGVDPGATIAYAILDVNGTLLDVSSSKTYSLSTLRLEIINRGKPLIVSTDKNPPPKFAAALARSLGARLIYPTHDLKIQEKKFLTKGLKLKNNHQRDALSSVLFAYRKLTPIIQKIKRSVPQDKINEIIPLVVTKRLSISRALEVLHSNTKTPIKEQVSQKLPVTAQKINPLKEKNQILVIQNKRLRGLVNILKEKNQRLQLSLDRKESGQKNSMIINSNAEIMLALENSKQQIQELRDKIFAQNKFFSDLDNKILLKKLDTLSFVELSQKLKIFDIKKGDILYVNNPSQFNQKTLDFLKDKINTIVTPNKVKIDEFIVVDDKDLDLEQIENYAKVSKQKLEQKLSLKSLLYGIISEYKQKRQKEITPPHNTPP